MISALGFLKLSCSLLINCFAKPRRKSGSNRTLSTSSEDEAYNRHKSFRARTKPYIKKGIKRIVGVLPPRAVEKPHISLFSYFMNNKRQQKCHSVGSMLALDQQKIEAITQQGLDQVKRRTCMKSLETKTQERERVFQQVERATSINLKAPVPASFHQELGSNPRDLESQGSISSDDYPCDASVSDDSLEFPYDDDLDILYSPRTSNESSIGNKLGVNLTFFTIERPGEDEDEEEEEKEKGGEDCQQNTSQRNPIRRIHSVVELNKTYKQKALTPTKQNFLLNPAYGSSSLDRDQSEAISEEETETKLKNLQSIVKEGCRASCSVLVESKYIGHTSLNPTFGDLSLSGSCSTESEVSYCDEETGSVHRTELQDTQASVMYMEKKYGRDTMEKLGSPIHKSTAIPRSGSRPSLSSMPIVALEGVAANNDLMRNRMGMKTWRNTVYALGDESEEERRNHNDSSQNELFCTPPLAPSPFQLATIHSGVAYLEDAITEAHEEALKQKKKVQKPSLVAHAIKSFEDIDLDSQECMHESLSSSPISQDSVASLKCESIETCKYDVSAAPESPLKPKVSPVNKAGKFVLSGLKQTRWVLRTFRILVGRIDIFGFTANKRK